MKKEINVFVHTIEDIDYFTKNIVKNNNTYIIYVSHAGVYEYIKEFYDYKVVFLPELLTQKEIDDINLHAKKLSNDLVDNLDQKYSMLISQRFNVEKLNYFRPLYLYHLQLILSGFLIFEELLLKINDGNDNVVFDYSDNFYGVFTLKEFLTYTLKSHNLKFDWKRSNVRKENKNIVKFIIRLLRNLNKVYFRLLNILNQYLSYISRNKKTILYMESLYNLDFIKRSKQFKLVPYGNQALSNKFCITSNYPDIENINDVFEVLDLEKDDIEVFIASLLIRDFVNNSSKYYIGLKTLDDLINKDTIDLAIWGNPPTFGFKALFYEYCRVKDIKVLGMQHGSGWLFNNNINYDSEFTRCDYYISYGFSQGDYEAYFGSNGIKIYPYGSTKLCRIDIINKKNTVDILFPVSNTVSIFNGGFFRVRPDVLHNEQMKIVSLLENESKNHITSLIKPYLRTNILQTSVFLELKKLKFAKVDWDNTFVDVLNKVNPKCVVIEYMSTPLYEVLGRDVEIILFIRENEVLTSKARKMLEKRVHIVKNFKEFENIFINWKDNKLPKKRDDSYFNYYVNKADTKTNIVELIKSL
ncbi:MAG: hypothetical protein L3I99_04000 [Sulfurimonas sp.]|nr:hypothetical protein [Sulfurimonas sp.]